AGASGAVPFVRLRHLREPISRVGSNDYDFPRFVDFDPVDMHTGCSHGFERSGHVLLPECGGRAGHGSYREILLSAMIEARSWVMRGPRASPQADQAPVCCSG